MEIRTRKDCALREGTQDESLGDSQKAKGRFKVERQTKGEEPRPFPFLKRKSCDSTAVLALESARAAGDRQRLGGFELLGLLEFLCHDFVSSVFLSARVGERRILCTLRATVSSEKISGLCGWKSEGCAKWLRH
jgi:hypothetical protein